MTAYSFSGLLVDVKGYNWHMSAKPDTTLNASLSGASTSIEVGAVVEAGTASGTIDNAQVGSTTALGIANKTLPAGDGRPLEYTWAGVVRVMTDNTAILVGSKISAAASGKVKLVSMAGDDAADLAAHILGFGKALEANGSVDGTIIMAYIFMSH
jgi:hypothetical protein